MESEESKNRILKNANHGLHHWFKSLRMWLEGYRAAERLVWLKISGVPLHGWEGESLRISQNSWGKTIKNVSCNLLEDDNIPLGKVLICTSILSPIDSLSLIKIGPMFYRVKISEEDQVISMEEGCGGKMEDGLDVSLIDDSETETEWSDGEYVNIIEMGGEGSRCEEPKTDNVVGDLGDNVFCDHANGIGDARRRNVAGWELSPMKSGVEK